MSLLGELHRRNVFRVAVAYGVVAWVLIQVADIVFPRLGLPDWTVTLVIVMLALGFPLALAISWAFELTPDGLKRAEQVDHPGPNRAESGRKFDFLVIAALSAALAIVLVREWVLDGSPGADLRNAESSAPPRPSAADLPSIAVLPFRNVSEDAGNVYFAEGIAEEILSALVKLADLKVVGRASSFAFRDEDLDLRRIGGQLNARYILDGSVRKQSDRVRIAVQLTDSGSGYNLWSESYDARLDDIFDVQKQISRSVVGALKLELMPEERDRLGQLSTSDPQAYDAYLKGLNLVHEANDAADYDRAVDEFEWALRRDPTFVEAEAGKCRALYHKYEEILASEIMQQAIEVCDRAASMDEQSPQVQVALGGLYLRTGRVEFAQESYRRAIELAPTLEAAHRGLGEALARAGRMAEANQSFEYAIELNPRSARSHASQAIAMYNAGQLESAAEAMRRAASLDPDNPRFYASLSGILFKLSRFREAAEAALKSIDINPSAPGYSNAGTNFYYAGAFDRATEMFHSAIELAPSDYKLHGNLADACRMQPSCKDWQKHYLSAIELADERLGVDPDDALAIGLKGMYLAHLGRRDEATALISRALELTPDNNDVLWAAAVAWSLFGEPERAAEFIDRALAAGYPKEALAADPFIEFKG